MELVTKKKLHIVSGRANLPLAVEIAEALGVELGDANTADFANGEIHCRFGEQEPRGGRGGRAMERVTKKRLHIVAGRAHLPVAVEFAGARGVARGDANTAAFANGEIHGRFGESVRGMDVFIIQSHGASGSMSVNDTIFEHLQMVDAARRASAKRITAVMPFYGYGRQDRKAEGREPITAKLVANMFAAAGADRLMSVDLHSGQIQGFFDGPFDHLVAMPVLVRYLQDNMGDDIVVVSPDAGRVKVAERYANALHRSEERRVGEE